MSVALAGAAASVMLLPVSQGIAGASAGAAVVPAGVGVVAGEKPVLGCKRHCNRWPRGPWWGGHHHHHDDHHRHHRKFRHKRHHDEPVRPRIVVVTPTPTPTPSPTPTKTERPHHDDNEGGFDFFDWWPVDQ
ncbi:hypothetical protein FE391_09105 [Nonomuraea sp. KC401]|uniref:hypothetical protein n=1 Tax=unclassified Nonomuraea TaxID=2593643 RepID=UPI0010FD3FFD|nr:MULTISPECIES: hypothetical protein [unclassified Nonomuraea]NBE92554.1 hypothetical protein [Nonomuraea sp. K271]TLF79752.1 hypothetical protein FE391_09105 [Nonomuraea sp. KC401]